MKLPLFVLCVIAAQAALVESVCPCCNVGNELVTVPNETQCLDYGYIASRVAPDGSFSCALEKCTPPDECEAIRDRCGTACVFASVGDPSLLFPCLNSETPPLGCIPAYNECIRVFPACRPRCVEDFNTCYRLIGPGGNVNACVLAYSACILSP